ncbi:hypothetical protein MCO_00725 [Bartonella sp. DB5-6]|uniref:type IV secretion system protein n=1 Tax=Bartonella sp. DB5-6 TaxID=1094755 RepID=UPI00026E95DD|nr:type IV secretion system protein [Bartonella sp. DB5-6]EJF78432.1 hypothetical protein MCO_00725 [Bartonella sp. DB5-6]
MRKLIITVVISVILGMSSSAQASDEIPSDDDLDEGLINEVLEKMGGSLGPLGSGYFSKKQEETIVDTEKKPTDFKNIVFNFDIVEGKHDPQNDGTISSSSDSELLQKQTRVIERIYNSITGNRTITARKRSRDGGFYFLNPHLIYNVDEQTSLPKKIPELFRKTIQKESYMRNFSIDEAREAIDERNQYAAIIDRAVSMQIFEAIENRFHYLSKILIQLDKMQDLKAITELQTRIKGAIALLQNETIKLQMIAYSRNIEQALIHRLQRKRNVQILNSRNSGMPTIRHMR